MFDPIMYTLPEAACLALGLDITSKNKQNAIKRMKKYRMTAVYMLGWVLYPTLVDIKVQRKYPSIYIQYPSINGPSRGSLFYMTVTEQ